MEKKRKCISKEDLEDSIPMFPSKDTNKWANTRNSLKFYLTFEKYNWKINCVVLNNGTVYSNKMNKLLYVSITCTDN